MEHPILMPDEGVRAILAGRKTQTRQVVKADRYSPWIPHMEDAHADPGFGDGGHLHVPYTTDGDRVTRRVRCRYAIGDRLWVRETFASIDVNGRKSSPRAAHFVVLQDGAQVYRDGAVFAGLPEYSRGAFDGIKWRPSTQMPRWASRILLEVTAVRAERLHDITEEDACAEGVEASATTWVRHEPNGDWELSAEPFDGATPERATARDVYERLWHAINGKRAPWSSNPWVWVVSFRKAVA